MKAALPAVMILGAVIWVLIIGSCSDTSVQEVEIKVDSPVMVYYEFMDSTELVDEKYRSLKRSEDSIDYEKLRTSERHSDEREGFHYYDGTDCYLVMVKPSKLSFKKFESLVGHEMTHCLFGSYHPESGVVATRLKLKQNKGNDNVKEIITN